MNPLTLVKRIKEINSKEAALGISEGASWHVKYKESPYVYVGGLPFDLTEGDLLAIFSHVRPSRSTMVDGAVVEDQDFLDYCGFGLRDDITDLLVHRGTTPSGHDSPIDNVRPNRSRMVDGAVVEDRDFLDYCGYGPRDDITDLLDDRGTTPSGHENAVDSPTILPAMEDDYSAPFIGMKFQTIEDAKKYYQEFGAAQGFNVRTRTSQCNGEESGKPTCVKYVCSCEGKYKGKKVVSDVGTSKRLRTSHDRHDCLATMNIKICDDGTWEVSKFANVHTHVMGTPSKKILLRSQRGMFGAAKKLLESFDAEGLQLNKVVAMFGETTKLPFDQRDCWNHMRIAREYNGSGDAQSVRQYLQKMMIKDPNSYHAIQQDEKGHAINFFWVDGRSRNAYTLFGDVVSFDTTYRTNKYRMPFAPFTGVNHHGQSVLFGCALLENEVEGTFVWAFENWLQAMGGRAPTSIITDQDKAMSNAIARILPDTRHRYCIWHIKKKFAEKLGTIFFRNIEFRNKLDDVIHRTYTVEEFEGGWASLVEEYKLEENEWLNDLYKIREKWVPVYSRTTFFAGMMTSQRSESINHFFDRFVTPKTTLFEFVKNYRKAVARRYEDERKQDVISLRERIPKSNHHLLEDAARVYSAAMYNKFSEQFESVCRLRVDQHGESGDELSFKVRKIKDGKTDLIVTMNLESMHGSCTCHLFEFLGIPCRHILAVLDRLYVTEVPPSLILGRWRKDAALSLSPPVCLSHGASLDVSEAVVASDFCRRTQQLSFMAAKSDEGRKVYNVFIDSVHSALREIEGRLEVEAGGFNVTETIHTAVHRVMETGDNEGQTVGIEASEPLEIDLDDSPLLDPQVSQPKGRTRSSQRLAANKRMKSGLELAQEKKKQVRRCKLCNTIGHYASTCPGAKK